MLNKPIEDCLNRKRRCEDRAALDFTHHDS